MAPLQVLSQAPQWVMLVRSASQPSDMSPLQSAYELAQEIVHWPAVQLAVACGSEQSLPQPPQFRTSVFVFVQMPLQSTWPAVQTHVPATQFAPSGQAFPQPPQ
jgi:hypothetical protein